MEFPININEDTQEVNFGTLIFQSGKKIMLSAEEVEELEDILQLTNLTHNKEFYIKVDLKEADPDLKLADKHTDQDYLTLPAFEKSEEDLFK